MARLTVSLFGSLDLKLDGQPVAQLAKGKARALLAYLVAEAGRPHQRETLAGLLWPDWSERSARNNLRNVLSNLRTHLPRTAERRRGAQVSGLENGLLEKIRLALRIVALNRTLAPM